MRNTQLKARNTQLSLILYIQPVVASLVSEIELNAFGIDWNMVIVIQENTGSDLAMTYEVAHRLTAKKWHNQGTFQSTSQKTFIC